MKEQDYISIVDYLDGTLSVEQKITFEKRLETDAAFKVEYEQVKLILEGVRYQGRAAMKLSLAAIHTKLATGNQFAKYQPSGGGGFSLGGAITKIISVIAVVGIASAVLLYFDKFPMEHPLLDQAQEQVMKIDSLQYRMEVETVYQEVIVPAGTLPEGEESVIIYENELEEGQSVQEYLEEQHDASYD